MDRASGPERRTIPMPPRPGGVEMAAIVSGNGMDIKDDMEEEGRTGEARFKSLARQPGKQPAGPFY
jgi:hypothetical protein